MRPWHLVTLAAAATMTMAVRARPAAACAACSCGDPTLTTMGAEQPFKGRLRVSVEVRHRSDAYGSGSDRAEIDEVGLVLGASYAPRWWLQLAASMPLLLRTVDTATTSDDIRELGDLDLSSKVTLWRDRAWAPRQLVGVQGGVKLATAPVLEDDNGLPLAIEAQPGTSSIDLTLGASYARFAEPWSFYASAAGRLPVWRREDIAVGAGARGTVALQYQPEYDWAMRLGSNLRIDAPARLPGYRDPNTGGVVIYASPGLVITPREDLLLEFSINVPIVNLLDGVHDEGPIVSVTGVYDL
ncbi:MAG: transporter [Deltaproteobacteria bacterium]|nr:transporter [Deltaproteobacteria bacterium]